MSTDYAGIAKVLTKAKNILEDEGNRLIAGQLFATEDGSWPGVGDKTTGFCIRGACLAAAGLPPQVISSGDPTLKKYIVGDAAVHFLAPIVHEQLGYNGGMVGSHWAAVGYNNLYGRTKEDIINLLDLGITKAERLMVEA